MKNYSFDDESISKIATAIFEKIKDNYVSKSVHDAAIQSLQNQIDELKGPTTEE